MKVAESYVARDRNPLNVVIGSATCPNCGGKTKVDRRWILACGKCGEASTMEEMAELTGGGS